MHELQSKFIIYFNNNYMNTCIKFSHYNYIFITVFTSAKLINIQSAK